jgi:pimeloyl-ACP methyl ester carboxylesterase
VHGAWSGAHGFHLVRPRLWAAGHACFTPSLTGIGERAHLASPEVGLTTHIRDVVNHVRYEDLEDIVLLGFSYGGFVVTGALAHIAERVRHLVYLDAFVPDDGDSVFSLTGRGAGPAVVGLGEDWLVPATPRAYDDPAEAAFANPRRVAHPIGWEPSPSAWPSRSSPMPSSAPTSGPPRTRPTRPAPPSSRRRRPGHGRQRRGTTTRSPPTTWWPATARPSWPSCC